MRSTAGQLEKERLALLLADVLEPALGRVDIVGLDRLKGGYSREMWSFDAHGANGSLWTLILCADSEAGVVGAGERSVDRVTESALLHALHDSGVPVPDALCAGGADGRIGRPFFVMERLEGTAAIGAFQRDPWYVEHHVELATQLAELLAGIHAADIPETVLGKRPGPDDVAPGEIAHWREELGATPEARTPTIDRALVWLDAHHPSPPARVTLVHGDFRIGNILHGRGGDQPDGLRAVLDWELAHYGDPVEDVAFAQLVCWRVGTGKVGGLVSPRHWVQLYRSASGAPVDSASLRFWEVLGSVKMSCLLWRAASAVSAGSERSLLIRLMGDVRDDLDRRLLRQSKGAESV